MSANKTLQHILFLAIMAISAVVLCVVGVYATGANFHLRFTSTVNPDIFCKIEVGDPESATKTTIFDNNTGANFAASDFLNSDGKLKNFSTTISGNVASSLEFTLTNYTQTKHIRLSISAVWVDGNPLESSNVVAEHNTALCTKAPSQSQPTTSVCALNLSSTEAGTHNIEVQILVEEVFQITTSGTGLGNPQTLYFSANDTIQIPLVPSVGFQLPNNLRFQFVQFGISTVFSYETTYTTTSNLNGFATCNIEDLKTNTATLVCNCEEVFSIHKNALDPLFAESTTTGATTTYDANKTYMPNNGKYSYNADNQTEIIRGADYKNYQYYVKMGLYPQTRVTNSALISSLQSSAVAKKTHQQHIGTLAEQSTIRWYEYENNYYVQSQIQYYGTSAQEPSSAWFRVEPIVWIVLGASNNGENVDVDSLFFKDNMFYTDAFCGKPFTGQLTLMSAFALDSSKFDGLTGTSNFATSEIYKFLNNSEYAFLNTILGNKAFNNVLAASTSIRNNYVAKSSLTTISTTTLLANFFLLGSDSSETHWAGTYFENGAPEPHLGMASSTIALASPTDYALAHYAELSTDGLMAPESSYIISRGWGVDCQTVPTTSTSAYWTRSSRLHDGRDDIASLINMNGFYNDKGQNSEVGNPIIPYGTVVHDPNITVRPCMVLDMGYYHGDFPVTD